MSAPPRHEEPGGPAEKGQQETLRQRLAGDSRPGGSERESGAHLTPARSSARGLERGQVRAGDEEQECRSDRERAQRSRELPADAFEHRARAREIESRHVRRDIAKTRGDRPPEEVVRFHSSLGLRRSGSQPSANRTPPPSGVGEERPGGSGSRAPRPEVGGRTQREPEVGGRRVEADESPRRDADNRERDPIDADAQANGRRRSTEFAQPERVADDGDSGGTWLQIVVDERSNRARARRRERGSTRQSPSRPPPPGPGRRRRP